MSFSIKHAIICDDVRMEHNGKAILIGVYGDRIMIPEFPQSMAIAFWVEFEAHTSGTYPCEFQIVLEPEGAEKPILGMDFECSEMGPGVFSFGGGVQINDAGALVLKSRVQTNNEWSEWSEITRRVIAKTFVPSDRVFLSDTEESN